MLSIITIEDTSMFIRDKIPNEVYCANVLDYQPTDNALLRHGATPNYIVKLLLSREIRPDHNNVELYMRQFSNFGLEDSIELIDGKQHGLNYNGSARVFAEQLNSIPGRNSKRAIGMLSGLVYLFPKSFWDAVLGAGYYVVLDELFESSIQHIEYFVTWATMLGLDLSKFIMLSCRTHCHASRPTNDPTLQTVDDDYIQIGFNIISVPSYCWALTRNGIYEEFKDYSWPDQETINHRGLLLNRRLKEHRLLAISWLHKHGLLDSHFDWSMTGDPADIDGIENSRLRHAPWMRHVGLDRLVSTDDFQQLVRMYPKVLDAPKDTMHIHPGVAVYANTSFSLVTESNVGCDGWDIAGVNGIPSFSKWYNHTWVHPRVHRVYISVTEKSYRPLSVGHPFIILGGFRTAHTLRQLGFVSYNETGLIDESYDEELDDTKRLIKALEETARVALEGFNLPRAREIGRHNKEWFWNDHALRGHVRRQLIEPLLNLIH